LPPRISLDDLELFPALYQSRASYLGANGVTDKGHVATLAKSLKASKNTDFDAITVLRVGTRLIVIDGHHRLAAYRQVKRPDIPVQEFPGCPRDAAIEAGRENKKDRLPMGPTDRSERAWVLVCMEEFSKTEIEAGSGASEGTVAKMRKKFKALKAEGKEIPPTWAEVLRGKWEEDPDREVSSAVRKMTQALTQAIGPSKTFKNPSKVNMLGDALIEWSDRHARTIALHLVESLDLYEVVATVAKLAEEERREWAEAAEDDDEQVPF
jgi:hypothetical protein